MLSGNQLLQLTAVKCTVCTSKGKTTLFCTVSNCRCSELLSKELLVLYMSARGKHCYLHSSDTFLHLTSFMHEPIFPSEMPQMILRGTDSTKCWKHSHRFWFILSWYRHTIAADLCVANKCGIFHYISNGLRTDDCGVHLGMWCVILVDNTHLQKMGTMWSWRDGPGFLKLFNRKKDYVF